MKSSVPRGGQRKGICNAVSGGAVRQVIERNMRSSVQRSRQGKEIYDEVSSVAGRGKKYAI